MQYVRDEAHRFAQHYHHILRRKKLEEKCQRSRKSIRDPAYGVPCDPDQRRRHLRSRPAGALRPELRKLGEVIVVAPATEQSAVGHSVTLTTPLIVQEVLDEERQPMGWAVEGRPADCVKLALRELLPEPPDLIVSGLNAGSNAGINVLYSGTVAAAIEGAFFRCTSIACSLEYTKLKPLDFAAAPTWPAASSSRSWRTSRTPGTLFNVNIPSLERGPVRGIRSVPQNVAPYVEAYDRRTDPRGRVYFWSNPELQLSRSAPRHRRDRPGRRLHHRDAAAVRPDARGAAGANERLAMAYGRRMQWIR